jgi:calcineurin-like phosphoesterase family protein
MIYYTSDLHIGHENIIRLCKRPYSNAREMGVDLYSLAIIDEMENGKIVFRNA